MDPVGSNSLYTFGYNLGQDVYNGTQPQSPLVIIDYGGQSYQSGSWGAITVNSGAFYTMSQLRNAIEQYGKGFYYGTGSDTSAYLFVLLGTNNSLSVGTTTGQQWADSIDTINSWLLNSCGSPTFPCSNQVEAWGADDFEQGFGGASSARSWASSYSTNADFGNYYSDYGSADGCPPVGTCSGGWTQDDYYYVSWGASRADVPMPEIYSTTGSNAAQWERILEYGHNTYGNTILFGGSLTQLGACQQVDSCSGIDHDPDTGWTKLWKTLNTKDYIGHVPPAYANQTPPYSDDLKYKYS